MDSPSIKSDAVCSCLFGNSEEFFGGEAGRSLDVRCDAIDLLGVPDATDFCVVVGAAVSAGEFQRRATELPHTLENLHEARVDPCTVIKTATATFTGKFGAVKVFG